MSKRMSYQLFLLLIQVLAINFSLSPFFVQSVSINNLKTFMNLDNIQPYATKYGEFICTNPEENDLRIFIVPSEVPSYSIIQNLLTIVVWSYQKVLAFLNIILGHQFYLVFLHTNTHFSGTHFTLKLQLRFRVLLQGNTH